MKKPILLFLLMWLIWAVWSVIVLPYLPVGIITEILNSVAVKALVWILPLVFFLKELNVKSLFGASFPWLPCVILLCVVTVFLHTLRLLNGLQDTFIVFDPVFILTSVSAGVIEELSFRGGFFAAMESKIGFLPAALVNGALFMLYHYPELLLGQWTGLFSLRTLLIFIMGILFCWMFKKWKNLALNMVVHTYWNILSFLLCLAG